MKLAIIGSRSLTVNDLGQYLPTGVTEIVSGGARGIDTCAAEYARAKGLKLTEFCPNMKNMAGARPFIEIWKLFHMLTV